ncbi:hypothetical protein [Mesorhizobium sp. YM1C-6-2]|uniref:hypothetical protein n=1 Tax=Mesorhizobium sp. YM1C-6-2 TaxID=1827501 RepID=UPI000EF22A65|nr:hypothetical protein [Mesorhizobium sp. YM1C-6-2]RLP26169.1 hypothetical protein D8676_10815 [Mesorhizobium sp. YM1C-6-2]
MTRRLRIPGLVDLIRIDDPAVIAAASADARLDRDFSGGGPLINRWIAGRIRRSLRTPTAPLPSVSPRDHPGRAEQQAALQSRLGALVSKGAVATDHVAELAAYVRGERPESAVGPLVQEAIGRLFADRYSSSDHTWRAACVLDAAPRNMNPLRALWWAVTGALRRAQHVLSDAAGGDSAGVHATAVAVHSLVRSLRQMRRLWLEPGLRDRITTDAAVMRSLRAPESVPRRWSAPASTIWGNLPAGTLALFELDAARARDPDADIIFMAASWSRCPAAAWTTALLKDVWKRAQSGETAL